MPTELAKIQNIFRGAWAIFPDAQPTEQPRRVPGGGYGNDL